MFTKIAQIICGILVCISAQAQPLTVPIDSKGTFFTKSFTSADSAVKEVDFYFISRGNVSLPMRVSIFAPSGTTADMDARILQGAIPSALSNPRGWFEVPTEAKIKVKAVDVASVKAAALTISASCPFTDEQIAQFIQQAARAGVTLTRQDICPDDPTPQPTPDPNATPIPGYTPTPAYGREVDTTAVLHKDSCSKDGKNAKYLVRLKVHLDKIDAALFQDGFNVMVSVAQQPYTGRRKTLVKPNSDGFYRGQPILLMESTGWSSYGEVVSLYRWRGNKPVAGGSVKADPYRYVGNYIRVPIGKFLTGGMGTFEAVGGSLYGVCARLTRTRQEINGFPHHD